MAKRFSWKTKGRKDKKPWGQEEIFSAPWGTCGKILHINKGHRTSLKAYLRKDEILYLASGKILVTHGNDDQAIGVIAVIGPMRMNYGKVMSIVDFTADLVSGLVANE